MAFRASARPLQELHIGPHSLVISAEDLAGNVGSTGPIRFVVIHPFEDNFECSQMDTSKWDVVNISHGKALPAPEIQLSSGKMQISHEHTQQDDGQGFIDMYGISFIGKGVYDVSRQEAIVYATGVTESGYDETVHALGVALIEAGDVQFPKRLYLVRNGNNILAFYEDIPFDVQAWIAFYQLPDNNPVDLKIIYEEGHASFYVNNILIREVGIQLHYAMTGIVALSGFDGLSTSKSIVEGAIDEFWTDLAQPTVSQVSLLNVQRPDYKDIVYQTEQYSITAHGTPWQKHVSGRIYNPDRVGQIGNVQTSIDKLTITDSINLLETSPGSGIYESDAIPLNSKQDAQGFLVTRIASFASNEWFSIVPIQASDYASNATDTFKIKDIHITLVNFERPESDNILVGEAVQIMISGAPGQSLEGYLINPANMNAPAAGYIIGSKFTLIDHGDGTYSARILLQTNCDRSGQIVHILSALVLPVGLPSKMENAARGLNLKSRIIISGEPLPSLVIKYQEPYFIYEITNMMMQNLSGTLSGIVVDQSWSEGQPVYASFTD
ncbi:MAG: hypothetical protein ACD_48C00467G0001, partial [uncultured bacterium]